MHGKRTSRGLRGLIVAPATTLCVLAAIAGCGSSSSGPSDVVQQWISAARSGDAAKACSLMTPELQARVVTGGPCVKVFHTLAALIAPQLTQVKVGNASVRGATAAVPLSTPQKTTIYTLQRIGGRWIISNVANGSSAGQAAPPSGGTGAARAVVTDYTAALVRGDYQRACSDLSAVVISDMRQQLGSSCPRSITQSVKLLGPSTVADLKSARIVSVVTSGATGTATLQTNKSPSLPLKLVTESGAWKVRTPLFVGGCCG